MPLPLEGIRVVDLGQIYQGPYATFLMAMAGAEVIKVEPVGGERLRGSAGAVTAMSFAMLNSNKKSITLNLREPRGKELLIDLASASDVVLENFAPGVMDRLGVGHEVLRAANPRLIYATGTGYGISGPDRDQLAMDHTIQAASGIMSLTGEAGGSPLRAGGAPVDIMGGTHLYGAVVSALLQRSRTGEGALVEVSMQEAMYFALCTDMTAYHRTGKIPERTGNRSPSLVTPYSIYACADGHIAIICVTDTHWLRTLEVIGRDDLKDDPRFTNARTRNDNEAAITEIMEAWCSARTRDAAFSALSAARIPVAPVRDIEEVRTDPHMHERGMLEWRNHPEMGEIVLANSPIRFPEQGMNEIRTFPELGAHNEEIYGHLLGLAAKEIKKLADQKVI